MTLKHLGIVAVFAAIVGAIFVEDIAARVSFINTAGIILIGIEGGFLK